MTTAQHPQARLPNAPAVGPLASPQLRQPPGQQTDSWHVARQRFRHVAGLWTLGFAFAGLAFLLVPAQIGHLFQQLAATLHLGGQIDVRPGTLWHVLALSLMVSVTGLGWLCMRRPADLAPYRLLVAAKLASTLGFLWLAATHGTIWLAAAATDGFIALSLVWARQPLEATVLSGLLRQHRGQHPAYEVWFGKLHLGPDRSLWFRYTLLDGTRQVAALWAVLFDGDQIEAFRDEFPLELPQQGEQPAVQVGPGWLTREGAQGQAGAIAWDLRWTDRGTRLDHVPAWMAAVGLAKSQLRSPLLDLRVTGTVRAGARVFYVQDAPGMVGHIHGSRSGHAWAWSHCNDWEEGQDAVFEGLSAHVKVGGRVVGPLTSLVLVVDGRTYRFSPATSIWTTQSTFGDGSWAFTARAGGVELTGRVHHPLQARVALVRYTDTDGSGQWCHNSSFSALDLHLRDPRHGVDRRLVSRRASFEIVTRNPPSRPENLA